MITHLVSYSDTDAGGVLHHARYIELAERGYHAWLKRKGLSFSRIGRDHGLSLVVCDMSARYRSAVFLEDEIRIETHLNEVDRHGLQWRTRILKGESVAFSMLTKMVCLDSGTRSIISVPDSLIAWLGSETGIGAGAVMASVSE